MKKYVEKMKRFWNFNAQNKGGFTLVELIVVIAILAILAGIAVPAYSGYVEKAKKAEDEQLLATVNTAFAAACIENGTDAVLLDNAYAKLNDDGTIAAVYRTQVGDAYNVAFDKYFDLGEDAAFEVIKMLTFKNGMFVEGNEVYYEILKTLLNQHGDDIDKLTESIFDDAGIAELMGKVDYASALAAAIASGDTTGESKLTQLLLSPDNLATLSQMMGYGAYADAEGNINPEFEAALNEIIYNRAEILAKKNGGTADDYYELASADVMSNNAVLIAATSSDFDTTIFMETLASGNGKSMILSTMSTDTQTALSQSALAYAMYTGYAARNNIDTSNIDVSTVLDAISSTDTSEGSFRYYMNSEEAKADMDGYLASMNMLDASASSNPEAIANLLVNGFADPDLVAVLQQATNSSSGQ